MCQLGSEYGIGGYEVSTEYKQYKLDHCITAYRSKPFIVHKARGSDRVTVYELLRVPYLHIAYSRAYSTASPATPVPSITRLSYRWSF